MAEVNGRGPAEYALNRKVLFDTNGEKSVAVFEMPAVHAGAAIGDTIGSGQVLKKGTRLLCPVTLSSAAGTAGCLIAVGLRHAKTKVASDATAIMAATSVAASATAQVNTGTKLTAGQRYVLTEDSEIFATVSGAAVAANQAIRVEVPYIKA